MIEIKNIFKSITHIVHADSGVHDTRIMHPMREWLIGLGGVTLGVLCGAIFAVLVYQSYSRSAQAEIVVMETAVPYRAAMVERALETYLEKRREYDSLVAVSAPLVEDVPVATSTLPGTETTMATTSSEVVMPPPEVMPAMIEAKESEGNSVVPDLAI